MQAQLWTISGLAVELGLDRRSIARRIEDLPPDVDAGTRSPKYRMRRVVAHLFGPPRDGDALDLNAERARLASEQADKTAMENAVRRGELVAIAEVEERIARGLGEAKTALLAGPRKWAPIVIGRTRIPEVEAILEDGVRDALDRATDLLGHGEGPDAAAAPQGERVGGRTPKAKPGGKRRARKVGHRKG